MKYKSKSIIARIDGDLNYTILSSRPITNSIVERVKIYFGDCDSRLRNGSNHVYDMAYLGNLPRYKLGFYVAKVNRIW